MSLSARPDLIKSIGDHPLIASGLGLLFLLIVLLGGIHVLRVLGGLLLVLLQEFKHEVAGLGKVFGRVKRELSNWKVDK